MWRTPCCETRVLGNRSGSRDDITVGPGSGARPDAGEEEVSEDHAAYTG